MKQRSKRLIRALLCVMLCVMLMPTDAFAVSHTKGELVSNHTVVMTADEFIGYLQYVVDRDDSKYRSGGVWSVGQYAYDEADGKYHIYFDCNGLGESIVATRGKIVTNTDPNLNPWNLWDENIGVVSGGDTWFEEVCIDKSTDFSNLAPGEWLVYYKRG